MKNVIEEQKRSGINLFALLASFLPVPPQFLPSVPKRVKKRFNQLKVKIP